MKKLLLTILFAWLLYPAFSQKINGQWRGYFNSQGDIVLYGSDNTEYVLELEISGTSVNGFSYSYFQGRKYYVICKLTGTYYPNSNSIKVIESERIKGNTPPDFQDCFQIHYLTYEKEGKEERLTGKWITAPGQRSNCGDGSTTLTRRTLDKSLSTYNKQNTQQPVVKKPKPASTNNATAKKNPVPAAPKPVAPPVAKNNSKPNPVTPAAPVPAPVKPDIVKKEPAKVENTDNKKPTPAEDKADVAFEKRKAEILKTIEIQSENFKVDLYDNGEVDGDSISLFYNNRLILSHKRLSEKPITLTLDASTGDAVNELTMYAENLGEIPPNTALMVVTDGEKRYEVRISSDLKNSGTIRFIYKPKSPQ